MAALSRLPPTSNLWAGTPEVQSYLQKEAIGLADAA